MLSLLNLNRREKREEVYTVTKITGERFHETQSSSQTEQILRHGGQAAIYLFEKQVAYSKPLVSKAEYKRMSKDQKALHCTLNTTDTYVVVGDVGVDEAKLADLRESFDVYKVNAVEDKTNRGSIAVRHIKVLVK